MFTIKHVSLISGGETLHEGSSPTFVTLGSSGVSSNGLAEAGELHYTDAKGEVQTIRGGKVYVMNDAGKTVATYDLERRVDGAFQAGYGLQNPGLQNCA